MFLLERTLEIFWQESAKGPPPHLRATADPPRLF